CGATTGFEGKIDIRYLFSRQISIVGSYMGSKAELLSVMELVRRKAVKPVLDKIFPLTEAAEAHRRLEKREQFGKIVLRIP
ncbi:MAG TPA: zinc-binding dehydrogenase, partial [Candidatus Acidoferrales bacterium]|nr:zinc-binding dehydrogenase [Candidatus Acidoferrales bacterium]